MKKYTLYLIATVFCFTIHQPLSGQNQNETSKNRNCAVNKFTELNKYKGEGWSKIFSDRQIAPVLKATLKSDLGKLKSNLAQVDYPESSLSFVDENGVLTLNGAIPGLYTISEAALVVAPCGNIYAAVLEEGERVLYFTNDRRNAEKLPSPIENWKTDLEKRRRQNSSTEVKDFPVIFKNK